MNDPPTPTSRWLFLVLVLSACGEARGRSGFIEDGSTDTGSSSVDTTLDTDAGTDVGTDAGTDTGTDVGFDAGPDAGTDVGFDAGTDIGFDAGTDTSTGTDVVFDAGLDAGTDVGFDAGTDTGTDVGFDAGTDVGFDAGRDVYTIPPDANVCAMFPLPEGAPSARVQPDLGGAIDFAFDPTGRVAVAFPDRVVLYGPGSTSTPVVTTLAGQPVAIRYNRQGTLIVAYNVVTATDAGSTVNGRIGVLPEGSRSLVDLPLTDTGRIGGIATDREGRIWFTESSRARLMRVQPNGTMRTQVYAFPCDTPAPVPVCTPGLLAFGPGERSLFVSSASSARQLVVRLPLTVPDAGPATIPAGTQPTSVLGGFSSISGLASDECSNVYVTDTSRMDIVRVTAMGEGLSVVTRGLIAPRGLAFGAGPSFDERFLFFLSGEPLGLWGTRAIARGAERAGTPMSP